MLDHFDKKIKDKLYDLRVKPDIESEDVVFAHLHNIRASSTFIHFSSLSTAVSIIILILVLLDPVNSINISSEKNIGGLKEKEVYNKRQNVEENENKHFNNKQLLKGKEIIEMASNDKLKNKKKSSKGENFTTPKKEKIRFNMILIPNKLSGIKCNTDLILEIRQHQLLSFINDNEKAKKEAKKKDNAKNDMELYLSAEPFFSYNNFIPNKNDEVYVAEIKSAGSLSLNRFGFQLSVGAAFNVNSKLSLISSVDYITYKTDVTFNLHSSSLDSIKLDPDDHSIVKKVYHNYSEQIYYSRNGLGPTLGIIYKISSREKWKQNLKMSFSHYFLFSSDIIENNQNNRTLFTFSYGIKRQINQRISVRIQPSFKYSFQHDQLNIVIAKPFSVGLNLGLNYKFYNRKN